MADTESALMTTLDDFILSIAEGIVSAQEQLNRSPGVGEAPQVVRYCLPKVDFEIRLHLDMVESSVITEKLGGRSLRAAGANKHLVMRPISADEVVNTAVTAELASTIRGSFVAIPVDGGKTPPVLRSEVRWIKAGMSAEIAVTVVAAATGETLGDVAVEFNIDRERSVALSKAAGIGLTALSVRTVLGAGALKTAADGAPAQTTLKIAEDETRGARIAVTIAAAGKSETIVFRALEVNPI